MSDGASQAEDPHQAHKGGEERKPSSDDPTSALVPQVEAKLQPIIEDLPQEKQQQIRHTLEDTFMGFVANLGGPKIDPETARILAESQDKEGERRFQYLQTKQQNLAKEKERAHELAQERHRHTYRLMWPIVIVALLIVVGCVASGILLAATGHEILGASILTGIFAALLGYLGGLGTAKFFKK